jgi:hypothetical protein
MKGNFLDLDHSTFREPDAVVYGKRTRKPLQTSRVPETRIGNAEYVLKHL